MHIANAKAPHVWQQERAPGSTCKILDWKFGMIFCLISVQRSLERRNLAKGNVAQHTSSSGKVKDASFV